MSGGNLSYYRLGASLTPAVYPEIQGNKKNLDDNTAELVHNLFSNI